MLWACRPAGVSVCSFSRNMRRSTEELLQGTGQDTRAKRHGPMRYGSTWTYRVNLVGILSGRICSVLPLQRCRRPVHTHHSWHFASRRGYDRVVDLIRRARGIQTGMNTVIHLSATSTGVTTLHPRVLLVCRQRMRFDLPGVVEFKPGRLSSPSPS
jgi:hypothetical protein